MKNSIEFCLLKGAQKSAYKMAKMLAKKRVEFKNSELQWHIFA